MLIAISCKTKSQVLVIVGSQTHLYIEMCWVGRITNTLVHRDVVGLFSLYFTWKTSEEVCVAHSRLPVELQCIVSPLPSNLKSWTMCTRPDIHTTSFSANIHSWYVDAE